MKVHRYIYTRLSKELSPSGKNGFQSAFLPGNLLSNKEVLEIESHIHFPEGLLIESQSVVFHKRIKGELFLILLLLRPLSEVKDEHGRGGTFLCEGFLLAEQDWRPIWRISDLQALLLPYQFPNLNALLNSTAIDRTVGQIADLELEVDPKYWARNRSDSEDEPQEELLMAMYHVAKSADRDLAVVVEGEPVAVSNRLETCAMFMPSDLRPMVGWDDAFDSGKIFFSPLRIFGYSASMPTTGRPVVFAADGTKGTWTETEMVKWGQPSDPFSHWLLEVCVNPVPRAQLDAMYALSEAMISGRPTSANMATDNVFELVNKARIRQMFIQGLALHLDKPWSEKLADLTTSHEQLMIWMQSYQIKAITDLLESSMINENLTPDEIKAPPAAKLVAQGSAALQVMVTLWTKEQASEELLAQIPENRILPVLTLMLGFGAHKDCPYSKIVAFFEDHLRDIEQNSIARTNLLPYISAKIPAEYEGLTECMAIQASKNDQFACLKDNPTDWLRLVDQYLATTGGELPVWKAAKLLGKTVDLREYHTFSAFALGEGPKSQALAKVGPSRQGLLKCLIEVHGLKISNLEDLGFSSAEIENSGSSTGFFGKIKRIFGR